MDQDYDLISKQYIVILEQSIEKFAQQANERLFDVVDNLNRCKANLVILETKVSSFQPTGK
jgi:hypothetical protein